MGVDQSRGTITLADSKNHVETLGMPDPSLLKTVKPGDHVDVTYREAIDVSLEPRSYVADRLRISLTVRCRGGPLQLVAVQPGMPKRLG